ncbi:MAG: amidohydrolase family protein [Candidatus Dormiibacterota bacterium]
MTQTLFENASVLDCEQGTLLPDRSVLVEDGTIVAVDGPGLRADGATRVDVHGRTLMPGLIDAHVHVTVVSTDVWGMAEWSPTYVAARAARVMQGMLQRGFTTVRDVGGADFGIAAAADEGYFEGPRIIFGGKMLSQTGGAGDWRGPGRSTYDGHYCCPTLATLCDGVDEVRKAVREEVRRGAHHVKVYLSGAVDAPTDRVDSTQFSMDELRAVVEEAEAANIYVAGHAYTSRALNRGLEAGVRSIEHGNLMDESSIPLFRAHDAFYVPTLSTYHALAEHGERLGMPAEAMQKLGPVLEGGLHALELAHRSGLDIVYGTDLLAEMHEEQLHEFELRSEVQPVADVLRSATVVAARLLRLEGRVGVVAPGAWADLLVVEGDPLHDLGVLTNPQEHLRLIMKAGRVYRNELS